MIRLVYLELHHFKNVDFGRVDFPDLPSGGSITGIYGQNGSGKTAVVNALECIDRLMAGARQKENSADYLEDQGGTLKISAGYRLDVPMADDRLKADVEYEVTMDRGRGNVLRPVAESIAFKPKGGSRRVLVSRTATIAASADGDEVLFWDYTPKSRWRSIRSFSGDIERLLAIAEGSTNQTGSSLLFSSGFANTLSAFSKQYLKALDAGDERAVPATIAKAFSETVAPLLKIAVDMRRHSLCNVYVLPTAQASAISFNTVFLSTMAGESETGYHETVRLNTDSPTNVRQAQYRKLCETVGRINGVIGALIPGYRVEVKDLGRVVLDDGGEGQRVELLSHRGDRCIPFRCESEGVQKITAITSLLIDVYNDEDSCVAIDELDSGVFEFLLGELLEVLAGKCKGQLIFTAHNLRALETLPSKCLTFTTSNPHNRFVRFKGVRPSNNLRDLYLRAINIGGQEEEIYEPTDRFAIDSAFYRAGHDDEPSLDEILAQLEAV